MQVLQTKNAVELCDHNGLGDGVKRVFVRREMNVGFRYLKKECKVNKPTVETITESNVVELLQCGLHGEKKAFHGRSTDGIERIRNG